MHLRALSAIALSSRGLFPSPAARHTPCRAALESGASVVVAGSGTVCLLSARLAALRGFATKVIASPKDLETAATVLYDDAHPEGSLPLTLLPLSGPDKDVEALEAAVAEAQGLVLCLDKDWTFTESQVENFMPDGAALRHVSLMSRNLNGEGMGFFASAAKRGANLDVWDAAEESVANYKAGEAAVRARAEAAGAAWTIVRAGTLKGGGSGDAVNGGNGEAAFLSPEYYNLGQGSRWQVIYDCEALGVKLSKGDTLAGPGFTAALTATEKVGSGDSHRGAVATALVEALRVPAAANKEFGVAAEAGMAFPTEAQWSEMLGGV